MAKSFIIINSNVTINQTIVISPQPITSDRAVPPSIIKNAPVPAVIKRNAAASAADKNCAISVSMGCPLLVNVKIQ